MISDEFPEFDICAPRLDAPSTFCIRLHVDDGDAVIAILDGDGNRIVDGNNHEVFSVPEGVTSELRGLTVTRGSDNYGGGIENDGTLTLTRYTISSNTAAYGGGLHNEGTLSLTSSTVSDNASSNYSGGGIYNEGALTIDAEGDDRRAGQDQQGRGPKAGPNPPRATARLLLRSIRSPCASISWVPPGPAVPGTACGETR
jgi:hypothetical protein